ncbi:MAG: tetratricopeptide repeat protein [Acidobacteriia bacterium]|nr:tetratricopeptide repeat protein [Terriglobia bacterium]
MAAARVFLSLSLLAGILNFCKPAFADTYRVILKGTVVMEDGSPPPVSVGIERICSDSSGSAPGPTTNKKGEFVWNMEMDAFATRACYLRATHAGYVSSTIPISGLNATSHDPTSTLPPLVLSSPVADPYAIITSASNTPGRSKGSFDAAMKAVDKSDFAEAMRELQAAVKASPKFAQGWHALGVVYERLEMPAEARDAYQHAIDADPKLLPPYVTLVRVCVKMKDWEDASKIADTLLKVDVKHIYSEAYLHRAVARYELKDLSGAEMSIEEALRLDPKHKKPREEYVLGRILEAKGDLNGAREHISKYLELEPNAVDVELVRGHLATLGKPEGAGVEPALEPL